MLIPCIHFLTCSEVWTVFPLVMVPIKTVSLVGSRMEMDFCTCLWRTFSAALLDGELNLMVGGAVLWVENPDLYRMEAAN